MHMDHVGGLLVDGVRDRLRAGPAHPRRGRRNRVLGVARFRPRLPHAARGSRTRFGGAGRRSPAGPQSRQLRTFEEKREVAPGVLVARTARPIPGHSVVRLASGSDRLTFAGDAVFRVGVRAPRLVRDGFGRDPEEAARVRVRLLRELAANRKSLLATHLSFPSVCHVAVEDGDVFRWVPGPWEY